MKRLVKICTKTEIVKLEYNFRQCGNEIFFQQKITQSSRKFGLVNHLSTLSTEIVNES